MTPAMTNTMRPPIWRSILAVVLGYLVIAVCTNFGFKPLGGIVHLDAPLAVHVAGTLVAVLSGLFGGATAAAVAGKMPVRHAVAVLLFLIADTAFVVSQRGPDPLWFELGGSLVLMAATVAGGFAFALLQRRPAHS